MFNTILKYIKFWNKKEKLTPDEEMAIDWYRIMSVLDPRTYSIPSNDDFINRWMKIQGQHQKDVACLLESLQKNKNNNGRNEIKKKFVKKVMDDLDRFKSEIMDQSKRQIEKNVKGFVLYDMDVANLALYQTKEENHRPQITSSDAHIENSWLPL